MEEDVGYPYLLQSIPQSKHHEVAELGNSVTPIGKELGNSATPTNNRSTKQGESATTSVKRSTEELHFPRSILKTTPKASVEFCQTRKGRRNAMNKQVGITSQRKLIFIMALRQVPSAH